MKKYLVEVISQYLVRYVVEAREDEHALDEVTMNLGVYNEDWKEFSQAHVGDTILSSREVTEDEIINIFDKDNEFSQFWSLDQKKAFINKIEYEDKELAPEERDWEYDAAGNKVYKGTMKKYGK